MEYQLYKSVVALLLTLGTPRTPARFAYSDEAIVTVYYWAVINDRPTSWACDRASWPIHLRGRPLPSPSTMSRRLRSRRVLGLLEALARRVIAPRAPGLFWMIDGKPLVIGGCSKDRQAGYGRAAGGEGKGYKLHALVAASGPLAAWRVAPMNKDERVMAERLLKAATAVRGYVLTDANYDSNALHALCDRHGDLQMVTPRRYGPGHGTGHRKQTAGRLRSMALLEGPRPEFGLRLHRDRGAIERQFGNLSNWGGGLTCLPPWVRTHRRVRLWVQAKLVLSALKPRAGSTTCAA